MKRFFGAVLTLAVFVMGKDLVAQELRFAVPEYMPFTGLVQGQAVGQGVNMVARVMKEAGLTMKVHVVPNYSRCIVEIQTRECDGFFLGSRNADRDAVAVMSEPLMINNWVWVIPRDSPWTVDDPQFKSHVKVGVMLNTNLHVWLRDHGYNITGTPTSSRGLVNMLDAGRFDVAFVPELIIKEALKNAGKKESDYRIEVYLRQPFSIYLSKTLLETHPGILDKVNSAIKKLYPNPLDRLN